MISIGLIHRRRGLGTFLVAVTFGLAAAMVTAPTAHAAGSCYGDYCSGKWADEMGCDRDAVTVAATNITGARLELRWSPACQTNWARYQQYPRGWYLGMAPIELRAVQDTGYTQRFTYRLDQTTPETSWTPMIYSPTRAVRAELAVSCGGMTLMQTAMDCAMNGLVTTGWA